MPAPRYPALYQINTRVWLTELSRALGRRATLEDVSDAALDSIAEKGFDWVWLLSVWQTGSKGRALSRSRPEWRSGFEHTLPDLTDDDIGGSGFAIASYTVNADLGGEAALRKLRERMSRRGLRLMLDFVPNHLGPDHLWASTNPEFFVQGTEEDLAREPANYCRSETPTGPQIFAYGRDPYFPGWLDTLQLNYGNPAMQEALMRELERIARQCDGVRCDMAMLVLPKVFDRTWGIAAEPFWPRAIARARRIDPQFVFMAEVYWDLEWELQQQGFNYCYDKRLYDRLRAGDARPVREHLSAGLDFQDRLARFLENHDEQRAAAIFDLVKHRAAALVTYLTPGLRFFHQGQLEGKRVHISPHLVRGPIETPDAGVAEFYDRLLEILQRPAARHGDWELVDCREAWPGNGSHDAMVAFCWRGANDDPLLVTVNFSDHQSQARLTPPIPASEPVLFHDLLTAATHERSIEDLRSAGLYVDLPPWGAHAFSIAGGGRPK